MMVKAGVFLALTILTLSGTAAGYGGGFGLGIILGEPTGLVGKLWTGNRTAIDVAVAWSLAGKNAFHLHVDYLFHSFNLFEPERGKLPLYYGIGGRIKFESSDKVGVRVPVGINYIFADVPIDLFFEIVPLLELMPSTEFDLNGAIGMRYFF